MSYQRGCCSAQKYGTVEQLLQAQQLDAAPRGLIDERQVLVEHPLLDVVGAYLRGRCLP